MTRARLDPRLRDRLAAAVPGPGWRRAVLLRRVVAGVLAVAALVLALVPPGGTRHVPVLVAAVDLTAGATLRRADLTVRQWPRELAPLGTMSEPAAAEGRVLAGSARAGEPITDARLAGATPGVGPGTAAVPVRLADPAVAELLGPGRRVDVVGTNQETGAPEVLAAGATVVAVLPAEPGRVGVAGGRMILVSMPRDQATSVAAGSLAESLAITLR